MTNARPRLRASQGFARSRRAADSLGPRPQQRDRSSARADTLRRMARASAAPSARTRVKRVHERAAYDRATIDAILDAALVCHLGFEREGQPYVIPTLHARIGDLLYVHGSAGEPHRARARRGHPRLRHRDAARRDRARPLRLRALDQLPLGRRARHRHRRHRSRREVRRARGVHREAAPRPLRRRAAADPQGAEGDGRALAAARRGVGEGAHGRARRRRHARRRARRLGRPHPARRAARSPRSRRPISGPGSRCRRTRSATGGPASPAEPAAAPEVRRARSRASSARARSRRRGSGRGRPSGRPSSRGSARRSRSGT